MKATLDLDKLLKEQEITQREYDKFGEFAQRSTGSLAYGILLGFGVIAASAGAYRLIGAEMVAILVGLILLVTGLAIWHVSQDWGKVLAGMFILTGALMASSGILEAGEGSRAAILGVTLLLAASGVLARSGLLVVVCYVDVVDKHWRGSRLSPRQLLFDGPRSHDHDCPVWDFGGRAALSVEDSSDGFCTAGDYRKPNERVSGQFRVLGRIFVGRAVG